MAAKKKRAKVPTRPRSVVPTSAGAAGIALWMAATRWRRLVEADLAALDLTLAQWLVLEATAQVIAEKKDATSQSSVAARLEMDRMTVSQVMRLLERRGLVSRGPDVTGPALRVWVTPAGQSLLERGRTRLEAASARALGSAPRQLSSTLASLRFPGKDQPT